MTDDSEDQLNDLLFDLRSSCKGGYCSVCKRAADALEEYDVEIEKLQKECAMLESEVKAYRDAAKLYGVDANTMLVLAKSQIKTSADNIRIMEKIQEIMSMFDNVPECLSKKNVYRELTRRMNLDKSNTNDMICCALEILLEYVSVREELDEWRKWNLPFA